MLGYLLLNVEPEAGKTLNAVLFERLASNWQIFGLHVGPAIITFTLLTEGALLFVAAQTGFVDGPRVLATMATDRWLPRRFANLSARLVTQDGVIAMGLAAMLLLIGTDAKVDLLVVLYAINVFMTFTLSQLGMTTHWWSVRKTEKRWLRKLLINGVGTFFTATILVITLTLKFYQGGWVTVLITGGLIARVLHRAAPLRASLEGNRAARGGHPAETVRGQKAEPAKRDPERADRRYPGQRLQRSWAGDTDPVINCSRTSSATWSSSESAKWMLPCSRVPKKCASSRQRMTRRLE